MFKKYLSPFHSILYSREIILCTFILYQFLICMVFIFILCLYDGPTDCWPIIRNGDRWKTNRVRMVELVNDSVGNRRIGKW